MNSEIIPKEAFITKDHIIKYMPEIELKMEKFNDTSWRAKFPFYPNVNYRNLQLSNIGAYSIISTDNSKLLINILNEINTQYKFADQLSDLVITEANGGVGGFSIRLSRTFRKLNIVEISKLHVDILTHNLKVYNTNLTNINIYNADYLDILYDLKQDVILFDLPWNGYKYKIKKNLYLGLNNINIWYIINKLHEKNKFKVCIVMVPKNFDFQNFIINIESNVIIRRVDKHYYIIIL
jgi:16S rRNA G966 N2-methylase RsmD